ncbi:phosphoenolpyruvate-protein phosphotransferase [Sporosarcina sp. JAI121]|nr:phosphoenolpyruvate-protein phosphotransferase [Sporosarcina sp. JAI121]
MNILHGISASNGIAIAKAYRFVEPDLYFSKKTIEDIPIEIERFQSAIAVSKSELESIRDIAEKELGADEAAIFNAHVLVLIDPELISSIEDKIKTDHVNAEYALKETTDMFITMFEQMDNEYMRERASDIRDVTKRLLSHLLNVEIVNPGMIAEEVVIIAEDLTPSDTAQLNRKFVKGFTTNIGGKTSHSAIMARTLEIPAVVGTKEATELIQDGDIVIVDGFKGTVHINPTSEVIAAYEKEQVKYEQQKAEWAKLVNEKTISADGHHVELAANIGTPEDLEGVLNNGGRELVYTEPSFCIWVETNFQPKKSSLRRIKRFFKEWQISQ